MKASGGRTLVKVGIGLVAMILFAFVVAVRFGVFDREAIVRGGEGGTFAAEQSAHDARLKEPDASSAQRRADPAGAANSEDATTDPSASRPETSVRTRFIDERAAPLAGVELSVARAPEVLAQSGPDGNVDLALDAALPGGSSSILAFQARCPGFARDRRIATVTAGKTLLLGDWTLVRGGSVEGIVLDENGRGLAGVEVACLKQDMKDAEWERSRRDSLEGLWRPAAAVTSSADGRFRLEECPAGRIRLVAVCDDRPAGRSAAFDLPAGGVARGIEIRMEAADGGTTIAGIVLDPARTPVAHASVRIAGNNTSYGASADDGGRFEVRLDDRQPRVVTAADPEQRYREARREGVTPGTKDLVLELGAAPRIELTVHSRDGAPVEHFAIATIAVKGAEVLTFSRESEHVEGMAEVSVPEQDFHVEVRANGFFPSRLGPFRADAPPTKLECTLDPAGGVHGVVLADGKPLSGAFVGLYRRVEKNDMYNGFLLRTETSPVIETESEEHGAFSLSVEEAGSYYLRAEADGYALAEVGPLQLSPRGEREERLELGSGGTLEVRVRSRHGASVAGTLVAISRGDGLARTERAGEEGDVSFPRLTPGGWLVKISEKEVDPSYGATNFGTKEARDVPTNCRVFAGETTRVDLWLGAEEVEGECVLTGRLVIDGKPAEGWLAGLSEGARAELAEAKAFAEPGAFRVAAGEAGSYRLNLRTDASDPSAMLVILDPVELYTGDNFWSLELQTGTLEGTLGNAAGESSLLFWRWERGKLQCLAPLAPGDGGRFRCARAPAGPGAIVRFDPGRNIDEQTPVVLRELTLEAGKTISVEL